MNEQQFFEKYTQDLEASGWSANHPIQDIDFEFDDMYPYHDSLTRILTICDEHKKVVNYIYDQDSMHESWFVDTHDKLKKSGTILQVLPSHVDYNECGFSLAFRSNVTDLDTGTSAVVMVNPQAVHSGQFQIVTTCRKNVQNLLAFIGLAEGRYRSFYMSMMLQNFEPVVFAPSVWPNLADESFLFVDGHTMYALNWGQKTEQYHYNHVIWSGRKFWIFMNDYKVCVWNYIHKIEPTTDPRIIKVQFMYRMPKIDINDVNLITECFIARLSTDDMEINFRTSEIAEMTVPFMEDYIERPSMNHPNTQCLGG